MAARQKLAIPQRGEVYLVSFDPTVGAEIQKTRPALVLQNDVSNEYSPITIVAAITSKFDEPLYPTEVLIQVPEGGLTINSVALLNHIRSIDKERLIKLLGKLEESTMKQVIKKDEGEKMNASASPPGRRMFLRKNLNFLFC